MTEREFTDETIAVAMAKASRGFVSTLITATLSPATLRPPDMVWLRHDLARCPPEGHWPDGAIVSRGGRESFNVWLEVSRGLVKLVQQMVA
jgi:hypothetical protein